MEHVYESRPGLIAEANHQFFRRALILAGIKVADEPVQAAPKTKSKKTTQPSRKPA